jgi:ubiquinone biosynthesis accessory factor UbiK
MNAGVCNTIRFRHKLCYNRYLLVYSDSDMNPNDLLNKFSEHFSTVISPGLESLNSDIKQQISAAAQSAFAKMDFVSREEFEAQKAVLLRTREKLEALEKQVAELESKL